ncbi:hypothetical protein G6F46_015573 [Rhizopus delemar]|nr:hypothetical protein G6F46_015573 [Rhizopus delemar]
MAPPQVVMPMAAPAIIIRPPPFSRRPGPGGPARRGRMPSTRSATGRRSPAPVPPAAGRSRRSRRSSAAPARAPSGPGAGWPPPRSPAARG